MPRLGPTHKASETSRDKYFSDAIAAFDMMIPGRAGRLDPPVKSHVCAGCIYATLLTLAVTLAFAPLHDRIDSTHLSWLFSCVYLSLVGLIAWIWGTRPALLAAFLSFGGANFYHTPSSSLGLQHPIDLVELFTFLITAVFIGTLTGQLRSQRLNAVSSERVARTLASIAGQMAAKHDVASVLDVAIAALEREPGVTSVMVWMAQPDCGLQAHSSSGGPGQQEISPLVERVFSDMVAVNLRTPGEHSIAVNVWPNVDTTLHPLGVGTLIPIVSGDGGEGVLQVFGDRELLGQRTEELAVSVTHLLAIFCEGARAVENVSLIKTAEEAQRVKGAIVSAVSHELKSPLATIVAGVTDLLSEDVHHDEAEVKRTLRSVAIEVRRLESAITDLIDLSRLQADEWMPQPGIYESGEILGTVVASLSPALFDRIQFPVSEEETPSVYVDFDQVSRALVAVIDNAVCYSPPDSPIWLGAERFGNRTTLWVEDRGPGVADEDKPYVFDRAYRGKVGVMRPGGTGLGLTIARDLVEINSGRVVIEDALPTGTRIVLDLPAIRRGQGDGSEWSVQEG